MTLQWTEPNDESWGVGDLVTSEMMMEQVINNLRYLHNLGSGILTGYAESGTISAGGWNPLATDDTPPKYLTQAIDISGDRPVLLLFVARVRNLDTVDPKSVMFDFSFDDGVSETRVSTIITGYTGDSDPTTDKGLYRATIAASAISTVVMPWILTPTQFGSPEESLSMTFNVYWRAANGSFKLQKETPYLFAALELSGN